VYFNRLALHSATTKIIFGNIFRFCYSPSRPLALKKRGGILVSDSAASGMFIYKSLNSAWSCQLSYCYYFNLITVPALYCRTMYCPF
jgi:hypothetical protein